MQPETRPGAWQADEVPKKVDHEKRREFIASALMRVAAREGLEGLSLRRIAAEAGVTSGMVQHYFPSKDAMIHYAMEVAASTFADSGRVGHESAAIEHQSDPLGQIQAILCSLLPTDEATRDSGRVALAFMSFAMTHESAAIRLADGNALLRHHLATLIEKARGIGQVDSELHADTAAVALLALADGLGIQMLSSHLPADAAVTALRLHIDLLARGDLTRVK